jgi:leucyl-tRNA synthetase
LANSLEWLANNYETDTMPGYAGSSWYFLRYMDANNPNEFAGKTSLDYWQNVDLYFGGTEHAVGHLLYARLWHKVLFDLGYVPTDEPFQKVVNQGMIQGRSSFVYRMSYNTSLPIDESTILQIKVADEKIPLIFFSYEYYKEFKADNLGNQEILGLIKKFDLDAFNKLSKYANNIRFTLTPFNVAIDLVKNDILNEEGYRNWKPGLENSIFVKENEKYVCGHEPEKMSKSKYNTVDPTDVINKYGADCFRLFEMFLGPIEQSKPWDDKGIIGVQNFLRKFWRLFYDEKGWKVTDDLPVEAELKILHKTLKKVTEDIERFSYNTAVSAFMIATNELSQLGCSKKQILEPLLVALAPLAPFITEELWSKLGNKSSIHKDAVFPVANEKYLVETTHNYGVSINGKVRAQINLSLDIAEADAKKQVLELESVKKWTNGAEPKKFIFIKGKIINIVI